MARGFFLWTEDLGVLVLTVPCPQVRAKKVARSWEQKPEVSVKLVDSDPISVVVSHFQGLENFSHIPFPFVSFVFYFTGGQSVVSHLLFLFLSYHF